MHKILNWIYFPIATYKNRNHVNKYISPLNQMRYIPIACEIKGNKGYHRIYFNKSETNNSPGSMHLLTIDRPYVIEWNYLC